MNIAPIRARTALVVTAALLVFGAVRPMLGATPAPTHVQSVDVFVTNRVWQIITNFIEVRMPTNIFRDTFQTNWVEQFRTNFIDVYRTNWLTRTLTNTTVVELAQTNWVYAYQTNLQTVTMTNWETLLVIKTNRVTQPLTNIVEINVPAPAPVLATAPAAPESRPEPAPRAPSAAPAQDLKIELARTDKLLQNDQVEVQLTLRSASDPAAILRVQEWRLERADGTVFLFGQHPQFTADLPFGTYKVTVTLRRGDDKRTISVHDTVEITQNGVRQQPPAMVLSAAK